MPERRLALITGASGGLGRAISVRLARAGLDIAVASRTDDRYPGTDAETVAMIENEGGRAVAFECDLSDREQRQGLVERVMAGMGPVEVLVNNAAVSTMEPVAVFRENRFTLMFDVQVRAPFELAQRVLPAMRAVGRGWIVNISSPAAFHPKAGERPSAETGGGTVYGMCKAALERFSTGLAAEVYDDGVNVNSIAPTNIVPTFGAHAFFDLTKYQAEPEDAMADAVNYLVDPATPRLTGQILYSQGVLELAGYPVPRLVGPAPVPA